MTETLEALITALKVIGHGALQGLGGLASMDPAGAFLGKLNTGAPQGVEYYAVAADYEPTGQGIRILLTGAADAVLDRVFDEKANDLVVPESGVYEANGCQVFPIPDERVFLIAPNQGVVHTTMFGHAPATDKLLAWLSWSTRK